MIAAACQMVGFAIAVIGIGIWSVPAALVVAGVVLFVSGGLEARKG